MFTEILPFVIVGLTTGAVYGMTATGLVLTYNTSGIFNFAQGAVGTVAAYFFYELSTRYGLPWWAAVLISVVGLGTVMGMLLERFARTLSRMSTAMKIVGTLGIVLLVQGSANIRYGTEPILMGPYLPQGTFTLNGVAVGYDQVIVIAISLAVTAALFVYFRASRTGTAMRAVVDNPTLLASHGTNPVAVRRIAWIIGTMFASLAGVLLVPYVGLNSLVLTLLIVQAFGAAAIGLFSNLPLAYVGGLIVGVAASIATKYVTIGSVWGGLPTAMPFIILFVVLVVVPRRRLAEPMQLTPRPQTLWRAPLPLQLGGGAVLAGFLVLVPFIVGTKLPFYITGLCSILLFVSLGILVRSSGQVSLAQMAFAAIGAAAFAHFTTDFGIPWVFALLLAGLVAVPVGAFIAIPAIRLSGLYLALATLGFGIVMESMFYTSSWMFGSNPAGLTAPRPQLSWLAVDTDRGFYYVVLVVVVMFTAIALWLDHARFGRLLRGLADGPLALFTLGTSVNTTRVLVFCLSAFLAAISGGLMASSATAITGLSFPSFSSLTLVVLLALVPGRLPWYAFAGAFSLYVIPSFFPSNSHVTDWLTTLFGIGAIVTALTLEEKGRVPAQVLAFTDRLFGRKQESSRPTDTDPRPPGSVTGTSAPPTPVSKPAVVDARSDAPASGELAVEGLVVRFGGVVAVNDLSLRAPVGTITGLIGPNGAGKTTTFNACSGLTRPSAGRVLYRGEDISKRSAAARGRQGLGRTFQRMQLLNSLTVEENVAFGSEAPMAGGNPFKHVNATPAERRATEQATAEAMELCGIQSLRSVQVGLLSTGQRRLVDLARSLAGPYDMLLLDEPSSGLNHAETARFAEVLRRVAQQRRVGILIVEHDMSLVMSLCDYLYVLDFGVLLFEGTPAEVASSPIVREAYLGANSLEEHFVHEELGLDEVGVASGAVSSADGAGTTS